MRVPPGLLTDPRCPAVRRLAKTGDFYSFVAEMSRAFGDVVSLAPGIYLFATSQLIKETLRNTTDFRKSDRIDTFKILVGEGLFTADGTIYDQQERVIKSAFGKKYFAGFRRIIEEEIVALMDGAFDRSARGGGAIDLSALSVDLTMAIAARSFFGVGGETELAREFRKGLVYCQDWFAWLQAVEFAEPMLSYVEDRHAPLPVLKPLQKALFRTLTGAAEMTRQVESWKEFVAKNEAQARATAAHMRALCARIIAARRSDPGLEDKSDVLSALLRFQKDPENAWLTDEVVVDQVATFFVAGHETTSDLFVTLLWKHARGETPAAVVEELGAAGDMIFEEGFLFQKYPATGAYLNQALLEHPPIMLTVRQAKRDVEVGGYPIPEGSRIVLSIQAAQDVDVSFGFGRRQCIGRVFALEEAVIGLRHLLRFGLTLEDPAQRPQMTAGLTIGYSRSPKPIRVTASATGASVEPTAA